MSQFSTEKCIDFLTAARNGDLARVQTLSLDPEVDLNFVSQGGRSAFRGACYSGESAVVRYLLDFNQRPIDYNIKDHYTKSTAFSAACYCNRLEVVKMMLADERIDVDVVVNDSRYNPLSHAAISGDLEIVKLLLASGREVGISRRTTSGETAAEIARNIAQSYSTHEEDFDKEYNGETKKIYQLIASLIEEKQNGNSPLFFFFFFFLSSHSTCLSFMYPKEQWAGQLFADVVFLCDGYTKLPEDQREIK
jgi:ankyrin repeat protein